MELKKVAKAMKKLERKAEANPKAKLKVARYAKKYLVLQARFDQLLKVAGLA